MSSHEIKASANTTLLDHGAFAKFLIWAGVAISWLISLVEDGCYFLCWRVSKIIKSAIEIISHDRARGEGNANRSR